MPTFLVALIFSFIINSFFFVIAYLYRTDKVTDLSYGLSFILIAAIYLLTQVFPSFPQILAALMVMVWGIRLAGYLFYRISKLKNDSRFDGIRDDLSRFTRFWFFQALSVVIIIWPAIIAVSSHKSPQNSWLFFVGFAVWLTGLVLETVADLQKSAYKSLKNPPTPWVSVGLWKHARHPNYFGEMLCWWGLFIYAIPYLSGWNWLSLISPVFITYLLLFVTGIPLLEKKYSQKYAGHPDYAKYKSSTHLLIPIPRKY